MTQEEFKAKYIYEQAQWRVIEGETGMDRTGAKIQAVLFQSKSQIENPKSPMTKVAL